MWTKRWMWIIWPAFLAAGVLEMLVFAAFDPQDMLWLGHHLQWSSLAIYSVAFFVFWGVCAAAGAMTVLLSLPAQTLNTAARLS